jgi:hypothetical protein
MSTTPEWYALMEDPNETVIAGPFPNQPDAGDWGVAAETGTVTYRGSVRLVPRTTFEPPE